jgi:TRAP-type C4-dicarboxylate transport system substrate-binding protein
VLRSSDVIVPLWAGSEERKSIASAIALVLSLTGAVAACGGSTDKTGSVEEEGPVVLTFASNNGGLPSQIAAYLDEVERRAGGTLQLDYIDRWRHGEPDQEIGLIEDVQAGEVDMAWVGARAFDSVGVTSFQPLVAPFLVDSYDLQDEVFSAGIPPRMLAGLEALELTGIGVLPGPLRQMLGIDHAFTQPSDFAANVVGTSGGDLAERTLQAFGSTPRMVPAETPLDGLDGLDYHLGSIYGNNYFEGATAVTVNLDLWPRPLVIFAGSDRFADLSAEHQAVLRDAAAATIGPASRATRDEEAEGGNGLCSVGIALVELDEDDRAALVDAVAPLYDELDRNPETRSFLAEIRAIKTQTAAPPETLACPEQGEGPSPESTPIDGVWRVTTTAEELVAAGDPLPIPENYGEWVYAFDDGKFAFSQQAEDACTWGYGTYAVDGDKVEWSFVDGGGSSPNNAVNKPGERFVFGWSRYRDTLTLTGVPGEVSPPPFTAQPWRLSDETPSASMFHPRCTPPTAAVEGVVGEAAPDESLDGTWEISITPDELAAAGASEAELDDPFARGTWRLVLDDGDFAFVEPESGRTTNSGTYTVDGDELTLTHAANEGGAVFRVRWSLYRDSLTLERIPGVPLEWSGFVADVWQRVD